MKTLSKSAQRIAQLDRENTVLTCALSDLMRGDGKTFAAGRYGYALTVSRPANPCGGIVTVSRNGTVSAYYFEEFARSELNHIAVIITGENTAHNRELLARRSLIEAAQAYVTAQQKAA